MSEAAPDPVTTTIALVDLSSIAHPIWHQSSAQPDPDWTATQIVDRVRALTANYPHAAICCDKGKSFRHEITDTYKANRPEQDASLHHQIRLAKERLEQDGYPVWAVAGFEADDLIATAATTALGLADINVVIFSADKDLLQLVNDRVTVISTASGREYDEAGVVAKFGVRPDQIRDYLALVGDPSDNVKGARGIGEKKAAELLGKWKSLLGIYLGLAVHGTQFKPAMATALREFEPRMPETLSLVTLRTDVEIPFAELNTPRAPRGAAPIEEDTMSEAVAVAPAPAVEEPKPANGNGHEDTALVPVVEAAPAPAEWGKQLEPRSMNDAARLAKYMHEARLFNGYGSPQAVLSTILAGRELGMNAVASLRAFHIIEGKHALAADALRALVLQSGQAEYFRCTKRTAQQATFVTKRKGDPEPVSLTYTIEEGRAAFGFAEGMPDKARTELDGKWARSGWGKHAPDMLAARASSKLARLVYADILFGLYAPEELRD